jgi:DNA-binding response OmpR family regulator
MYEVAALLSARAPLVVTKEALYHAAVLNLMESERPDNILKVQVVKLRKVLKVHGIEIQTVWGTGYRMTTENAANWRALVAKYNPQLEDAA